MSDHARPPWGLQDFGPGVRYAEAKTREVTRRVALPVVVEVEVNSRCNRRCSYCPVSLDPYPNVAKKMQDRVFTRLLEELSEIGFAGRLSYHFYNEPLLRADLEDLVAEAAGRLPSVHQVLYTNGDYLSTARYEALQRAGMHWFVVTRHDSDPFPERPAQTVLVPAQLDLTNRGGVLFPVASALALPCYVPTEMLIVTVSGDVVLCYEDARRQHVFGNVMEQSLIEIWTSDRFTAAREWLARGERAKISGACSQCDNRAHTAPGLSLYSP
jgi:cyclic pyranopterin phosphate synthase